MPKGKKKKVARKQTGYGAEEARPVHEPCHSAVIVTTKKRRYINAFRSLLALDNVMQSTSGEGNCSARGHCKPKKKRMLRVGKSRSESCRYGGERIQFH